MTKEDGFEYKLPDDDEATFFPWKVNVEGAKDMLIIDSFTQLPIDVFHEKLQDGFERRRGPFLLALIATSIAAKFPDWTVQRIVRLVENLDFSKFTGIDADEEEAGDVKVPPETGEPTNESSSSPSDGSSSSATQTDESTSDTSNLTPA
jgi:hypothetical protein